MITVKIAIALHLVSQGIGLPLHPGYSLHRKLPRIEAYLLLNPSGENKLSQAVPSEWSTWVSSKNSCDHFAIRQALLDLLTNRPFGPLETGAYNVPADHEPCTRFSNQAFGSV